MKHLKVLAAGAILLTSASAQAVVVNFIDLANNNGAYGEQGYDPLTYGSLSVTATSTTGGVTSSAYAYLDSDAQQDGGGLGVCNVLRTNGECNPGNDDNVNNNVADLETLLFNFVGGAEVTKIWFNNNHDGGVAAGALVDIDGSATAIPAVDAIYNDGNAVTGSWLVGDSSTLNISFNNTSFYVSAIEYRSVPEPTILGLLGLGLIGTALARRKA